MESNKYYTPSIEEFHIGFECEIEDLDDNLSDRCFRPVIIDWTELDIVNDDWEHEYENFSKWYRVKYLDKEDIESLGFKYQKHCTFYKRDGKELIRVQYNMPTTDSKIQIEYYVNSSFCFGMDFIIKNKSELKVLLKQLGINGD